MARLCFILLIACTYAVLGSYNQDYSSYKYAGEWAAHSANTAHAGTQSHVHSIREKFSSSWEAAEVATKTVREGLHTRDALCDLAVNALVLLTASQGPCHDITVRVALVYDKNSEAAGQTAAASFCSECANQAKNAIANVALFCGANLDAKTIHDLRSIYYFLTVTCLQPTTPDATNPYCVPTIVHAATLINGTQTVPVTELQSICGGACFLRFAAAAVSLNPDYQSDDSRNVVYFGALICAQDSNPYDTSITPLPVYCINQLVNIADVFKGIPATHTVQDGFNAICSTRCIAKYAVLTKNFDRAFFTNFTIVCHRNQTVNGYLCINKLLTFQQNNAQLDTVCSIQPSTPTPQDGVCPESTGCRGNITALVTQLGCCATDFVYATSTTAEDRAKTVYWITNGCQATLAPVCDTFVPLVKTFIVYGLLSAYCQANPGVCEAAVLYDVALSLGLNQGDVTIGTAAQGPTASSTSFSLVFNTTGTAESMSTDSDYENAVNNNGILYTQTSQLPADAKSSSFGAIGTNDAAILFPTGTTMTTGAASFLAPTVMVVVFAALALFA